MPIVTLRIDNQLYFLEAREDVDGLKDIILTAVRGGGGFVEFSPAGHGDVSVLVTAHTPVRFEEVDSCDAESVSARSVVSPGSGYDYDFEFDMEFAS